MTNPFNKAPNTTPTAPVSSSGYNPFEGSNEDEEFLKILPAGVTAKVKILSYRIKPKAPNNPTAVFIDVELLEVLEGGSALVAPGKRFSHKIGGFESSGAAAARRGLKSMNHAIFPELGDDTRWDLLPMQIQAEGSAVGREIYLRTSAKGTKTINPSTGRPYEIILGEYHSVG